MDAGCRKWTATSARKRSAVRRHGKADAIVAGRARTRLQAIATCLDAAWTTFISKPSFVSELE